MGNPYNKYFCWKVPCEQEERDRSQSTVWEEELISEHLQNVSRNKNAKYEFPFGKEHNHKLAL